MAENKTPEFEPPQVNIGRFLFFLYFIPLPEDTF